MVNRTIRPSRKTGVTPTPTRVPLPGEQQHEPPVDWDKPSTLRTTDGRRFASFVGE